MKYDPSKKYAEIKRSALYLARKYSAWGTIAAFNRGDDVHTIIRTALNEVDVATVVATIYRSEKEVRFRTLGPHQAAKLAEAILLLQPKDLQTVWVYRALLDAPGFSATDRAKLFDIFVQSKDYVLLPDALKWIPDLSPEERSRLEQAVAEIPVEHTIDRLLDTATQIFPEPEAD
jgi:hypothetical protein